MGQQRWSDEQRRRVLALVRLLSERTGGGFRSPGDRKLGAAIWAGVVLRQIPAGSDGDPLGHDHHLHERRGRRDAGLANLRLAVFARFVGVTRRRRYERCLVH